MDHSLSQLSDRLPEGSALPAGRTDVIAKNPEHRGTGSRPIRFRYTAPAALLVTGVLLAMTTNLSKVAAGLGASSLAYLTWSLAGAALMLALISRLRGQAIRLNRRSAEYYLASGLLTVAGSNLIFFSAVEHLGVGFIALMLSLPPLLTYGGALLLRMEAFCWWRAGGIALGFAGTAYLVVQQWAAPHADAFWIAVALAGPVLLAAGNLYRSRRWPPGASPESLAPGMLAGALILLVLFSLGTGWTLSIPDEAGIVMPLIAVQAMVFAGQFLMLFVLQRAGGPVFLSLMGGVSAVFGVPIAMFILDEPALPAFIPSATLIALGIAAMLMGARVASRSDRLSMTEGCER